MYCIFCPNVISWRKVNTHELQLLNGNVPTRGAERWFFFTLSLDNCSCKSKRWLAWRQILQLDFPAVIKLGMNLVAAHYATSFRTVHRRVLPYLELWIKVLIGYWSLFPAITRHNSTLHWLKKLDCFPLPFSKEGRDVITACDRVYTYKGTSWSSG